MQNNSLIYYYVWP